MLLTNDEKSKKIRENFRQRFMEKRNRENNMLLGTDKEVRLKIVESLDRARANSNWFYTLPLEEDRKNKFGITDEETRELKGAEKRVLMDEEMRKLREENNLLWEAIVKLLKLI